MYTLNYSEFQIKTLLEIVKILIPVCTGFLVFVSVFLRLILEKDVSLGKVDRVLLVLVYCSGIMAIGLWSGVLSFLVDCSSVFGRSEGDKVLLNIPKLNSEWKTCGVVAEIAHLSFFLSVILFSALSYRAFAERLLKL